jgi:hypothetical protein
MEEALYIDMNNVDRYLYKNQEYWKH